MRRICRWAVAGLIAVLANAPAAAEDGSGAGAVSVERGRYIAEIAGCNDCHTPGYGPAGGDVPVERWLLGSEIGFQGPWGTTYPDNLRLYMQALTEDEWVEEAKRLETRPPMPWFNVRAMHESDLRSLYRFARSLGDPGEPAPDFVPPDEAPTHPYIVFAPPHTP